MSGKPSSGIVGLVALAAVLNVCTTPLLAQEHLETRSTRAGARSHIRRSRLGVSSHSVVRRRQKQTSSSECSMSAHPSTADLRLPLRVPRLFKNCGAY
jgi:hypothetical protein